MEFYNEIIWQNGHFHIDRLMSTINIDQAFVGWTKAFLLKKKRKQPWNENGTNHMGKYICKWYLGQGFFFVFKVNSLK